MSSLSIKHFPQKVEKNIRKHDYFYCNDISLALHKKCESDLPLHKRLEERVPRNFLKLDLPPILLTLRFEVMVYKFGPTRYKKDLDDLH